ncbi:MAG: 6-carboxytetrahydropterin synthase [Flavobacteriaceae bacterium TMED206]|nr:MAG: 6-carboxytetrahydropterin synthase [Flavobacteriaceae bacterium TMED206]|tara:strand:- start:1159 stop:1566 length:408 start_codon:yes stop_codon:yes gene_type:complete
MKVTICRRAHFNAAHKLYNKSWSRERNMEIFGKCSNENYHGHNYELIVKLRGKIDKDTGMVFDLGELKEIIKIEIEDLLDHKNLNIDIPYFNDIIPTTENLSIFIWDKLRKAIDLDCEISVTLYETNRNFVEYTG